MPEDAVSAIQSIGEDIAGWQSALFPNGPWYTIIVAVIAGLAAYIVIKLLNRIFAKRQQGNLHFFYRLINTGIVVIAVLMVMMTVKPLADFSRTLLAGSGLLAVVIGIAAQASLGNVFSGISIGISRPFVIGETIEIVGQDIIGTVTEISLRQTVIRDLNNKYIVVPNSVIDKETIRTVQQGDKAVLNYLFVNVGYASDVEQAIASVKRVALAHKDFYDARTPAEMAQGKERDVIVAVTDLAASAVVLRASVWSKDAGTGFMMLSDLRRSILRAFGAQGIEIPYAYQNVILRDGRGE